jgi:hypothetical protein
MYILMKVFIKTNLFIYIFKLNDLKVIHDLYSKCLTQTLSKTTSNREPEGVVKFIYICSYQYMNTILRK